MPKQVTRSGLLGKLGDKLRRAHEAHKGDETTYSQFGDLPPGIENGVAQLVDCKFTQIKEGKNNAGEWMFYAAGVVVLPRSVGGIPIEGLRTQISEPLFDTPNRSRETVAEHLAWIYNQLRLLGVNTSEMQVEDLEATAAGIKEIAPYFRFRTWRGDATKEFPNLRTNHVWNGCISDFDPDEAGVGGAVDDRGTPGGAAGPSGAGEDFDEFGDLSALAAKADNNRLSEKVRKEAQDKLEEAALERGIDLEVIHGADTWADVLEMIRSGPGEAAANGETEEPPAKPSRAKPAGKAPAASAKAAGSAKPGKGGKAPAKPAKAPEPGPEEEPAEDEEEAGEEPAEEEAPIEEEEADSEWVPEKGELYLYQAVDPRTKKPAVDPKTKGPKLTEVEVVKVDLKARKADVKRLDDKKVVKGVAWDELRAE